MTGTVGRGAQRRTAAHRTRQTRLKARAKAARRSPLAQMSAGFDFVRAVVARLPANEAQGAANEFMQFAVPFAERLAQGVEIHDDDHSQ